MEITLISILVLVICIINITRNHILRTKPLEFHYVSGSITPDKIYVLYNKKSIYSYNWIDGVDAIPHSLLDIVHNKYQQSKN